MARTRLTAIAVTIIVTIAAISSAFALPRLGAGVETATPPATAVVGIDPAQAPPGMQVDNRAAVTDFDELTEVPPTTTPSGQVPVVAGPGVVAGPPVHEVLPGAGSSPPPGAVDVIGELGDHLPVPEGLDFVAPTAPKGRPKGLGGPGGLTLAPGCSHQCISRGVAYPRGFGAELVVETTVPAELFISVIADLDDNGTWETSYFETTPVRVTKHTWALDHLQPGTTYHAMVAATDENNHTSHAWGTFTTLSKRDVFVEFGNLEITGGPGNANTHSYLGLDGPLTNVTPGEQGILLYKDLPRYIELNFWVVRGWADDLCEYLPVGGALPHGHDSDACVAWNSMSLDGLDLDTAPAGNTRWTQTSVQLTLHPPTGQAGALPPGFGDPYYFDFQVPVTLSVTYS